MLAIASVAVWVLATSQVPKPPLFPGTGEYVRQAVSMNAEAAAYFNQGMRLMFAFQKGEAKESFLYATQLDPSCALAHWGVAMSVGPDINFATVTAVESALALKSLDAGLKVASSDIEKGLIQATMQRFSAEKEKSRATLNRAFSVAMRELWKRFPTDSEVGTAFADSLMLLNSWNYWTSDGSARPGTDEILKVLRDVLNRDPQHPLANHLWIHAVEACNTPEIGISAADRLSLLQPGLAHNVHMPSHIYVRTGNWKAAIEQNQKAVEQDKIYLLSRKPLRDHSGYMRHNQMMLAYSASMAGQASIAFKAYDELTTNPVSESYRDEIMFEKLALMKRMGMWEAILAAPDYDKKLPLSRAMRHGMRAIAFAAQKRGEAAREEVKTFMQLKAGKTGGNSMVLETMGHLVKGEVEYLTGDHQLGLKEMQLAVDTEDRFTYSEPPTWMHPTRHTLGAALLDAGKAEVALTVYQADLRHAPNNGWSLMGMAKAYTALGRAEDAARMMKQFNLTWRNADITIGSSCLCLPSK